MHSGDDSELSATVLSPGVSDLAIIRDHPAVVSVKPIVSDTGELEQTPGGEYLHVAVRFLDGSLIDSLRTDYLFEGLRFAWTPSYVPADSNQPLKTVGGATIGYLVWHPYMPGTAVMAKVVPVLAAVLVLVLVTIAGFLLVNHKRTQRLRASEDRIRYLALHDALTGLPNRAHFNETVDRQLSGEHPEPVALLYLDLDRFKQVNDTLGHPAGDVLIGEFGRRLKSIVRQHDMVARIGGDEFTVMVKDPGSREEIESVCRRMVDAARRPFEINGNRVLAGVSIGVAMAPQDEADRVSLLRKADVALYFSKSTGRGRYSFISEEMDQTLGLRHQTEADLLAALRAADQLMVHYQPIRSAQAQRVECYEALLRWKHPERGWISPELFIPIAEESGLIEEIGGRVLQEACAAAANWPEGNIAVNVSGVELCNPGYAAKVASILMTVGLVPHRLELEITESTAIDETGATVENLRALRELGVKIAIDNPSPDWLMGAVISI